MIAVAWLLVAVFYALVASMWLRWGCDRNKGD